MFIKCATIVIIGANIGAFTVPLAKAVGASGIIISIIIYYLFIPF